MKILILGDVHGQVAPVKMAVALAKENGCQHIIQVGDWGIWTHRESGHLFLDEVNTYALHNNIQINALPGNHENYDHWNWYVANMPKSVQGFAQVRTNIFLIPRVHYWTWAGKSFLVAGGAASIDDRWRRQNETKPRTLWWDDEILTQDEVEQAKMYKNTDYLFTHDASSRSPFPFALFEHSRSLDNRLFIDEILRETKPDLHFHGHYHVPMTWENLVADDHYVKTYGLDMELEPFSMAVLDTETDDVEFVS